MTDDTDLMDDEGENQAVRCFLMMYGNRLCTVEGMKNHLKCAGYPYWPEWANDPNWQGHLTKAGAQLWLRHLFSLEPAATFNARNL